MEPIQQNPSITFEAPPPEERKSIVIKRDQKVCHPSQVPQDILEDQFLTRLINESLPKNYNFEIRKTIWKIKQTSAKRIILQLPEGLIRFGSVIVDVITGYFRENFKTDLIFIIMGDLTYGACCVDDYLAKSMGCDLIVHYAHSCLIPINKMSSSVKYLYIFLDIKFDLDHLLNCVRHNFDHEKNHIALASTIQFVSSVHEIAKKLKNFNYKVNLPQSRPLSSGEVLGCTAPKLNQEVDTILFICDGRFHLEALMIANPKVTAYRYDPYSRKLTLETYNFEEMRKRRQSAIDRAVNVMKVGGSFGFVLGTLGRQGSEQVYDKLVERLRDKTQCSIVKLLMPEVVQDNIDVIESVDVWVQVACPRLSIDWGTCFDKPLLNSYELMQGLKILSGSCQADSIQDYPMDFYARNSCGDHTPNHSCQSNENCLCTH